MKSYLEKVICGNRLNREEAREVMEKIMNGEATSAQIASMLTALRIMGESVDEIVGFAQVMREKAKRVYVKNERLVDTCGTGGDGGKTFNISTAAALVSAAGGIKVAKHGNRAVSSRSGSADVLEALGIKITLTEEEASQMLDETNLCFLFAPLFHQAMKHAVQPRKEIGFRTVFNLLGPLTNPAGAKRQLLGVFSPSLTETMANVLKELGTERCLVVSGHDGLDEISVTSSTQVVELRDGEISSFVISPEDLGIPRYSLDEIRGGAAEENAALIRAIFNGEQKGAPRDVVLLNSAAVFYLADEVSSLEEGLQRAKEVVDQGYALNKLNQLSSKTGGISYAS
ncbi:anthranilate phosphoribosyltransferase [Microaerobacter geothermalis]|uniref:anthranilate phosphoribosyltransferase n=1 Tax=Microaerobacter geothermalis TaxID=674972 RepID=UPI001F417611|nr:anthranilate phosphoribosyltransferase [Microaerobacter geothermalis]MCF6093379.1 anthranilate phosphoribosyltransferase [Microaerobacter geothermalis]